ncbi:MAG: NFACT family protein [Oscillospiraceae bacterium]|nr:NFACT family protein [Oscillospiraceae bacterium]
MKFDVSVTFAVVAELNEKLVHGKIDKIYQAEKDEIILNIRRRGEMSRLLISAHSQNARIHLTTAQRENPKTAPMFCMFLRKHLAGGRIVAIEQMGLDRVVRIDIENYTELGDLVQKSMYIEIMGKHSNIIIVDDAGKILDSIRHVDFTTSSARQVLPGLFYKPPPTQSNFAVPDNLAPQEGISETVDKFFADKDFAERMKQKSATLVKLITNNIKRCEKKIKLHTENIAAAENRDKYKVYGDLITANIYRIEYGMDKISVENYYDDNAQIEIPLKTDISPSQNAQKYYTRYNKLKATEKYANEQLVMAQVEREYLETVLDAALKAESGAELDEIRAELAQEGYLKIAVKKQKKGNASKALPELSEFTSGDGFKILVGKNNRQNDYLTMKLAYSTDIWLHTKGIAGSHVIIRTEGGREVPESTIFEAAKLAAYYSRGRQSANVAVDYTAVKNVKKPRGAKPGYVIYDNYNTVYVTPS